MAVWHVVEERDEVALLAVVVVVDSAEAKVIVVSDVAVAAVAVQTQRGYGRRLQEVERKEEEATCYSFDDGGKKATIDKLLLRKFIVVMGRKQLYVRGWRCVSVRASRMIPLGFRNKNEGVLLQSGALGEGGEIEFSFVHCCRISLLSSTRLESSSLSYNGGRDKWF